jgi:hypothetical protein
MNWSLNSIKPAIGLPTAARLGVLALLLGATVGPRADVGGAPQYIASSDKGGFQYSEPSAWPELDLDLGPIERQVAEQASTRCGTALAAEPLQLGDAAGMMEKMMGKAESVQRPGQEKIQREVRSSGRRSPHSARRPAIRGRAAVECTGGQS